MESVVYRQQPIYFSFRILKRVNENIDHLIRCFNAACPNWLPWGWFGVIVRIDHILVRGVALELDIILNLGGMIKLTNREYEMETFDVSFIPEFYKYTNYLSLFPMGYELAPLGDTVLAQAIDDDNTTLSIAETEFKTGMSVRGRVIAVGPECKTIKEGDEIYIDVAPNAIFKYSWGYLMQTTETRVGLYKS